MKRLKFDWVFMACLPAVLLGGPGLLSGQGGSYPSVGFSAGAGGVEGHFGGDPWDFGPVFGGRFEWSMGRSAAWMSLDAQPFWGEPAGASERFRAVYLLPTYAIGTQTRRIALGVGMGIFEFQGGDRDDGIRAGFVSSLSGTFRIAGPYSGELGWKRVRNVNGLHANVWTLQVVRWWRF